MQTYIRYFTNKYLQIIDAGLLLTQNPAGWDGTFICDRESAKTGAFIGQKTRGYRQERRGGRRLSEKVSRKCPGMG